MFHKIPGQIASPELVAMKNPPRTSFFDRLVQKRALARWERAARLAGTLELDTLRQLRGDARALRREIDRVLHVADGRLQLPLVGADRVPEPPGCDWSWRPELWRGPVQPAGIAAAATQTRIGRELTLFHNCSAQEITLRQIRNTRPTDIAPYGLRLDVLRFEGSFLSLVLDLPEDAMRGLRLSHLLRLCIQVEMERPVGILCRLNIRHGPNTEQLVRELPMGQAECYVDFDLAYTKMNERRVEGGWIDLIFEGPQMNQVSLRDLTLARHPRAEI